MAPTRIRNDLHAVQAHMCVRTSFHQSAPPALESTVLSQCNTPVRGEKLLARFRSYTSIPRTYHSIAEGNLLLTGNVTNNLFQIVLLDMSRTLPGGEIPHLSVVSIVRQPYLRSNEEELAIMDEHAAVIAHVTVSDRHSDVQQYILTVIMIDDLGEHFPGVQEGIPLEEMVQTAITGNLIHVQSCPRPINQDGSASTLPPAPVPLVALLQPL